MAYVREGPVPWHRDRRSVDSRCISPKEWAELVECTDAVGRDWGPGCWSRCELNRWFWSLTYETIVIMGRKLACVARAANTRERAGKSMGEKERSDVGHLHSSDPSLQEREGGDACSLLEERRYIASKRPFLATTGHHQHQRFS